MTLEMSKKLNKRQLIAAKLLGLGYRAKDVAKFVGVSQETISRWKNNTFFVSTCDNRSSYLCEELLNHRLRLIDNCHNILEDVFNSSDVSKNIKATLAIRYLMVADNNRSIYPNLEQLTNSNADRNQTNESFQTVCEVLDSLATIRSLNQLNSDEEFRKLVNVEIKKLSSY